MACKPHGHDMIPSAITVRWKDRFEQFGNATRVGDKAVSKQDRGSRLR
jgi:hypothetical protein